MASKNGEMVDNLKDRRSEESVFEREMRGEARR